tara:strand:- start:107436 stop:108107 length:672 start_codon:yes stop_codon:yes gene_type:complete
MHTHKRSLTTTTILFWALIAGAFTLVPGCNIATPIAYAIHGPEKIKPVYSLAEDAKTVVFVDDPSSQITQRRLRYAIANRTTKELLEKRILVDMLDPRGILTAASNERFGEQKSIAELGRSVGAEIVIYAVITDFSMSPETGTFIPRSTMRVKIIDVASGTRLWPPDEKGAPLYIQIPQRPGTDPSTTGERLQVEQDLAERTGLGLSQLFYKHEIQETVLNRR